MESYITTYSGIRFYPTRPVMNDIKIGDIAHALSMICRGNGHVHTFYSVGEHCINCANEAIARNLPPRVAMACLIHDASEAYMSDVPRPLKQFLSEYNRYEDELLKLVFKRFLGSDLTIGERRAVRQIDNDTLAYDLVYLLGEEWQGDLPYLFAPFEYGRYTMREIEEMYLDLYGKIRKSLTAG